jgi:hypothetical protein
MGLEDDVAAAKSEEARRAPAWVPPQPDAELLAAMEELRTGLRRRGVKPQPVYRLERVHRGYYTPGSYFSRTFVPPEAYARADEVLAHAWRFREANPPVWDGYASNKDYYLLADGPLVLFMCDRWPMRGADPQVRFPTLEGDIHWAVSRLSKPIRDGAVAYLLAVDRGEPDWLGPGTV